MRAPVSTRTPLARASSVTAPPLTSVPCTRPSSFGVAMKTPAVDSSACSPRRRSDADRSAGPRSVAVMLPPGAVMLPSICNPSTADRLTSPRGSVTIDAPACKWKLASPCAPPVTAFRTSDAAWRCDNGSVCTLAIDASSPPVGNKAAAAPGMTTRFFCSTFSVVPARMSMPPTLSTVTFEKPASENRLGTRRVAVESEGHAPSPITAPANFSSSSPPLASA